MLRDEFKHKILLFFQANPTSKKIAIQVPDRYLPESLEIYDFFTTLYPLKFFFIVSDSSFNDCCVDFISAQHLDADSIIHFGPFCSTSYPIPICFLPNIERKNIIYESFLSRFENFINNITSPKVLIILDQFEFSRDTLLDICKDKDFYVGFSESRSDKLVSTKLYNFYIPFKFNEFFEVSMIYVGPHEKLSLDLGCMFYSNNSLRIDSYSMLPFEGNISRELTKRSGLIDSIRCFDHVGILVENPNVKLHVQVAHCIQNICSVNDIIADIIYVGRLNEMKVGNFADVEFFIHLCCSGKQIFSFVKPIVSPFEFICAKFDVNFWRNQYLQDYELFLNYCDLNKAQLMENFEPEINADSQIVLKNFFELSNQLIATRKKFSYNGLEINSKDQELRLYKGSVGNSTGYDYESQQQIIKK